MEDSSTISRKRKAGVASPLAEDNNNNNSNSNPNIQPPALVSTIESLLAVPLEIIFRQISNANNSNNNKGKPLLTRAEARCFLKIAMLAQEMDCLVQTSNEALNQRLWCRSFGQTLLLHGTPQPSPAATADGSATTSSVCNPFLRPMLPLLTLLGSILTTNALQGVEEELRRILVNLHHCRQSLRQFSEQNWTLSDSLLEALGHEENSEAEDDEEKWMNSQNDATSNLPKGAVLAREKRRLSDLEEEVCNRIDSLLGQAAESTDDTTASQRESQQQEREEDDSELERNTKDSNSSKTMADVCAQLWHLSSTSLNVVAAVTREMDQTEHIINNHNNDDPTNGKMSVNSQSQSQQQQQQKLALFSYPETIQGLDQKMMHEQQQMQSTPMTMDALDDNSKPQGIPNSSAEMQDHDDDDDETVGDDAQEMDLEDTSKPAAAAVKGGDGSHSQRSAHSIVSNNSTTNDNNDDHGDGQQQVPKFVAAPTQSQVQNVGEALLSLAFQG